MQRRLSIDTLRGLACLLLVSFHVIGDTPAAGLRLADDHALTDANDLLALLRMPLFSFLSGVVYAWRPYRGDPGGFITGKLRRLIVPLLLVGTFFALLQDLTPNTNQEITDWRMLHIQPVAHFWFLQSLFIIFMAVALLERFRLLATPRDLAMVWLMAVLLFLLDALPGHFGLSGSAYLLPFFLLGLGCSRFDAQLPRAGAAWLAGALLAAAALSMALFPGDASGARSLAALLVGSTSCVLLLLAGAEIRWLAWVGAASFPIYLFHSMFSAATRMALGKLGVQELALLFGAGLAAGLLLPVAAAWVLRRVPLGHWTLGESSRRVAAKAARAPASVGQP